MTRAGNVVAVLVFSLLFVGVGHATAEPVVIGQPGTGGNCVPFGCLGGDVTSEAIRYQQVYNSTNFASPFVISQIDFYEFLDPETGSGQLASGTYHIYLSTTARPVGGLDDVDFDSNLGADNALFATLSLTGGTSSPVLSIVGTPFLYNPAAGNLLLDIVIPAGAIGDSPFPAFFQSHNGTAGQLFSRVSNSAIGTVGYGLVTGFNSDVAPVPEPTSVLLVGTGVALIGRRRRRID